MIFFKKQLQKNKIWFISIVAIVVMSICNPNFLSANNIQGLCESMMSYGVVAMGLTVCLIAGENNIAIGSILAFSGMIFGSTISVIGLVPAMLLALILCAGFGLLDGYFVAYHKMPAFLMAVVFMISMRGLALMVSKSQNIIITDTTFKTVSSLSIGPIPILFLVMILLAVAIELILCYTQTGRNLFAVGGSADVAEACGLNVRRYKMLALMFSFIMAGLGGIFLTTRLSSAIPSVGEDAIITTLPIVVIGGTSINGGKGGTLQTLSGILLMYLLFNIMSMFNIYVNIQSLVKGLILLIIVVGDKYIINKNRRV